MSNWLYEIDGAKLQLDENFITDYFGFIYKITNLETGRFYVGKKSFVYNKKKKLGKKEMALMPVTRGRAITTKVEQVDSGWQKYWSSSKELQSDVKQLGEDKFERLILQLCMTKKQLTYFEMYYQMRENVLHIPSYNDNILGKFFRKDFDTLK
jgi:hypothetical protein